MKVLRSLCLHFLRQDGQDGKKHEKKITLYKDTMHTKLALMPWIDDNLGQTLSGLTQIGNIIAKIFLDFTIFQVHYSSVGKALDWQIRGCEFKSHWRQNHFSSFKVIFLCQKLSKSLQKKVIEEYQFRTTTFGKIIFW